MCWNSWGRFQHHHTPKRLDHNPRSYLPGPLWPTCEEDHCSRDWIIIFVQLLCLQPWVYFSSHSRDTYISRRHCISWLESQAPQRIIRKSWEHVGWGKVKRGYNEFGATLASPLAMTIWLWVRYLSFLGFNLKICKKGRGTTSHH